MAWSLAVLAEGVRVEAGALALSGADCALCMSLRLVVATASTVVLTVTSMVAWTMLWHQGTSLLRWTRGVEGALRL